MSIKKASENFAVIERSGAVSVDLVRLLNSDTGRDLLEGVRVLREYNNSRGVHGGRARRK